MPEFAYTAITKEGQRSTASIQAPSLAAAGHLLKEQGLLPTEISEKNKKVSFAIQNPFGGVSLKEKIGFVDNLGIMLKAGISMPRALQILVKQSKNKKFQSVLGDIYAQIEQGKSLAEALEKYSKIFPNIVISMIKVGEISGNLEKSLEYLSLQLQREADLKSKVRGAMIYPSVIVGAMLLIGILMSIFVLPGLLSIFKEMHANLPPTTRAVMAFSDFMSNHTFLAVGSIVGAITAFILFYRSPRGKRTMDIFSLHFMVISGIIKKVNLAQFSRILSSLLKSGIPIVQALEVAGESLGNVLYKELLQKASADVKLGKPLADSLGKNETLFPTLVAQMVEVGEESGSVQEILEELALHYEEEVDTTLKNLSSIIEPLLLLIIGGVVGMLALALISPIYSIYQNAS